MNDAPVLIPLQRIHPNPYQIRQAEDPEAVAELADNIKKNGLLQPPTVRAFPLYPLVDPVENDYELVFGHTRLAAFKILADQAGDEYAEMPCFIRRLDNLQMFEMAVAENIKRRDLNPVEQAAAMKRYMQDFGKSSQEAGEFFNVDEATVRGTVRLLGLPEVAKEKLSSGEITIGAARKLLVLVRVAPDSIEHAVQRILEGDLPDKVIEGALDGIVYHNKAIKMWASWHNGKPQAGQGLWELDTPTRKFAKYMPPVAGLEGVDIRLAKKALEGEELTAQNRPQLEEWVHKLQSGLVAPEALIAQGAPADTIERLEQLVHPPACTACPFYVRADNNHYCTWKVCHTRKKEAWCYFILESAEKSLNIQALSKDEARGGFVALEHNWNKAQNELVEGKDPNLRLHIKPQQYTHGFTGSEIVEVVTIAAKAVEEKKIEKKEESRQEREASYAREHKLRSASDKFVETEAMPVFVHLLDILDNLGFLMALARIQDDDFEPEAGEKAPTRKEKLQLCRMAIIGGVLDSNIEYFNEIQGPPATAGQLQGVARTWGVELAGRLAGEGCLLLAEGRSCRNGESMITTATSHPDVLTYPAGLEKAVLFILSYHIGSARAIGREALVLALVKMGHGTGERAVRECIKQLRRKGNLICSMPGVDGGYYMADTWASFDEFDRMEFSAKIADMNETRQAMLKAARAQFGEAVQVRLI